MLKTLRVHIDSPDGDRRYVGGGLILCEKCQGILGYLNAEGYREVQMILHCRCGNTGVLRTKRIEELRGAARFLRGKDSLYACEECGTPLFSLNRNRLNNFSFRIICACGSAFARDVTETSDRGHTPESLRRFRELQEKLRAEENPKKPRHGSCGGTGGGNYSFSSLS